MPGVSGWEGYVHMIQHKYNKKKQQYTKVNVCSGAAIYGKDGSAWAVSEGFPELKEYSMMQEMDDGGEMEVKVNEFQCALGAAGGSRKPSAAGILMGNKKYVFMKHDQEYQSTYMVTTGGGATVAQTKKAVVIGFWDKTAEMKSLDGKTLGIQNAADCGLIVEDMATLLKDQDF